MYFHAVPKTELLLCDELSGKDVQSKAPHWWRMIASFNLLSQWVCTTILTADQPQQRAEHIGFFVRLADQLQTVLADYNAAYAIISALSDSSIERLKGD